MTQFLTSQYWLAPQALTFTLNALGDPQKVAVSVSSGAMVMAYMPGVEGLGFDNAHSYRRWPVSGYASVLKDAVVTTTDAEGEPTDTIYPAIGEKYVYILIPRNAQSGSTALVGFAPCIIDYLGYTEEGVHIGTDQYYYLYIQGIISASVEGGNRTWQQDIVSGTLATEEAYSEGPDIPWYRWNALSQSVSFLKRIVMDAASWFSNLRTSSVQFVGNGTQDKGTLTSVADFGTISDSDTGAVVTTKYLADREEEIEKKYLRKDQDDETTNKLTFADIDIKKVAQVFDMLKSDKWVGYDMTKGKGWGVSPDGYMQLESLEVRSSLKVLELIYNRLSAQESEFVFTEAGTIETVTPNLDGTYTCTIKRKTDTDFHAFKKGDVLRGVVNDLTNPSGGVFMTAWMAVIDTDTINDNSITVSVYADKDVPSGSNTIPTQHMVVQRWGNNIVPSEDAHNNDDYRSFIVPSGKNDGKYINTRQSCWYISSIEKRIAMLDGVNKPKISNDNYSAFFGLPYNFENNKFKGHTMDATQPYLYVRGAFLQDIHYIDYLGNIVRQERARGVWSSEIAGSDDPYVMNDSTYDTVYHENAKWQCAVEIAMFPPSLSNPEWVMLSEFSATTYTIIPSVSQIVRDINGAPIPPVITCDVIKQVGSAEPTYVYDDECEVWIGKNQEMPEHSISRRYEIPDDAVSIEFYRFNKETKLDNATFGDTIFSFLTNKVSVSIITKGENGITPTIGTNGNWWINGVDTGLTSKGDDGHTPYIGDDGYWYEWNAETTSYEKTDTYAKGNSVIAQYSTDEEHWHYGFAVHDIFMRTSEDSGITWNPSMRIVGEEGAQGNGGDYIDTSFGISASLTNPSDVDVWADAPMLVTEEKPYLWMRQMKKVWDSTSKTYKDSTESAWRNYRYIRVTGEKGEKGDPGIGLPGERGEQGVSLRGPSMWDANTYYESGADGEQFQDQVVLSDSPKEMFLCKFSHKGVKPTADTISNENWSAERPWAMTEYREYTASKVLFAERGRIENLDIDNATIRGTITSDTTRIDGSIENKTIIVDAHNMKSLTLASMGDEVDTDLDPLQPRMVVLPMLNNFHDLDAVTEEGSGWKVDGYAISGTTLKIQTEPCIEVANWASYNLSGWSDPLVAYQIKKLFQKSTLVCADPYTLVGHSENEIFYPDHRWFGGNIKDQNGTYMHGRFSCRGIMSRFILLPPGQSLTLTSSIQKVKCMNGEIKECLVWNVENASDFEPISVVMTSARPTATGTEYHCDFEDSSLGMNPMGGNYENWKEMLLSYKGMSYKVYNEGLSDEGEQSIHILIHFANCDNDLNVILPFWQPVCRSTSKFAPL